MADHCEGRGFHLAVMLGPPKDSGQPDVPGPVDEGHFLLAKSCLLGEVSFEGRGWRKEEASQVVGERERRRRG